MPFQTTLKWTTLQYFAGQAVHKSTGSYESFPRHFLVYVRIFSFLGELGEDKERDYPCWDGEEEVLADNEGSEEASLQYSRVFQARDAD